MKTLTKDAADGMVSSHRGSHEFAARRNHAVLQDSSAAHVLTSIKRQSNGCKSVRCVVCGATVCLKYPARYRLDTCIKQRDNATRLLVKSLREHCLQSHAADWIWNVVPPSGILQGGFSEAELPPLDGFLHLAMKNATRKGGILPTQQPTTQKTAREMLSCFIGFIGYALCYLELCPRTIRFWEGRTNRRLELRDEARHRLLEIRDSARAHMQSTAFESTLETLGFEHTLNRLLLFFVQLGRYKRCNLFVEPSLSEEYKHLDDIE